MVMIDATLINRLKECMENEGKSCSFDPELITAEYVTNSSFCRLKPLTKYDNYWYFKNPSYLQT